MRAEIPDIAYVGCLDGFQPVDEAVAAIMAAGPDMVLCGMGRAAPGAPAA